MFRPYHSVSGTIEQIIGDAEDGKQALFTGLPERIRGLLSYLLCGISLEFR
jgi:hypothetical protein